LQGLSLAEIATRTGIPKTTVRAELIRGEVAIRPKFSQAQIERWRRRTGKRHTKPPYGFCFLEGELTRHPTEYPVLMTIRERANFGACPNSIASYLNARKIPSSRNRTWSRNSVVQILKRFEDGQIVQNRGNYELR
jgi:IS30 family transposase